MDTSERTGCIYIATVNEDKSYIGLTIDFDNRKYHHISRAKRGENTHFYNAIRKHGAESVEWRILEDDIPESRLPDREELWIGFYDTYYNGYNMTEGGRVSISKSPEVAAKISATMKAQAARGENPMQQDKARAKSSITHKAKAARGENPAHSAEARAKISASNKSLWDSGTHPMQDPEISAKRVKTLKRTISSKKFESEKESGQQFLTDMELDSE